MTYINDQGKLTEGKFPIFYPYIKINDGLGHTPANYHVYSLIGYKQAADPDTKRLNYIPIYGLVSKKGYKYRGHTVVEYGKESQFDFNKESVWDYTEALQNQEALADMADDYSKPNWQNSDIHLITDLPPYQNMNYAKEQQDMVFEWEQDDKDESEQDVVLSEADESKDSDSKNILQLEADLLYKMKEYLTELSKDNTDLAARKTYKGFITQLKDNQIFVFGSNTQGRHGKGAALIARNKFGAIYGQAEGPQGQSYAIITKDLTKSIHPSRTKEQITQQIHDLYEYARNNPDKEFLVAYSGTGTNLNAYSNKEMADMFSSEVIPNNIMFEDEFNSLLNERNWVDAKIEEFTQLLRKENPTTPEEVEGLINKFICNL